MPNSITSRCCLRSFPAGGPYPLGSQLARLEEKTAFLTHLLSLLTPRCTCRLAVLRRPAQRVKAKRTNTRQPFSANKFAKSSSESSQSRKVRLFAANFRSTCAQMLRKTNTSAAIRSIPLLNNAKSEHLALKIALQRLLFTRHLILHTD